LEILNGCLLWNWGPLIPRVKGLKYLIRSLFWTGFYPQERNKREIEAPEFDKHNLW